LKRNSTLERLFLAEDDPSNLGEENVRHMETVLRRYNSTLTRVKLRPGRDGQWIRFHDLLERNRRVGAAVEQLAKLHHVSEGEDRTIQLKRSVLPAVLERIGPFPTLLYRFLRWGDVHGNRAVRGVH
jgi:hypothetical protein